jgi:transposase
VEFRQFLDGIESQVPVGLDVHIFVDNYGTHKTAIIQKWFAKRPRFHFHTPTYGSWINLVERWFAELTNNRIRRGGFRSVKDLEAPFASTSTCTTKIPNQPLVWTKTADKILASIAPYAQRTTAAQASHL